MCNLLYLQLKERVTITPGEQLYVRHVADALDTQGADVMDVAVNCPKNEGVWRLPAMAVIQAVSSKCPEVQVMGPPECFVHIIPASKRNRTHVFRTILAFLLLMTGSALAITWFHADVNMIDAQQGLYRLVTGKEVENMWLISIPYALGVFLGVALFYSLLGKKHTVSPLDIKHGDYLKSAEEAMGQMP